MSLSLAAVIPTRNRPQDLEKAVVSILHQQRLPEVLMIVDQSEGDESADLIKPLLESSAIELIYLHDPVISGLVEAKKVAAETAVQDLVCFLEDDVVLEPGYFASIEAGFHQKDDMLGCSGVITNQPYQSRFYRLMHGIFFRGIFRDPRVRLFGESDSSLNSGLIRCDVLSGWLSAWRREVLLQVPFDVANGFFMFEDMEYSTRVVKHFGHHLYVNPGARLEHHMAVRNRDPHGYRQRRKSREAILFYKKRRTWPGARSGLAMGLLWWFAEAIYRSLGGRTAGPLVGYWRGIVDGIHSEIVT